jgi:hypothetical protein
VLDTETLQIMEFETHEEFYSKIDEFIPAIEDGQQVTFGISGEFTIEKK